jgi:hypothetical protein
MEWIPRENSKRERAGKTSVYGVQANNATRNLEPDQ